MGYNLLEWQISDDNQKVEIHVAGERRKGGVGIAEVLGLEGGRLNYKWLEPEACWWSSKHVLHKIYFIPFDSFRDGEPRFFYILLGGSWKNNYYYFYKITRDGDGLIWKHVSREEVIRHFLNNL